jgi:hypothetical protein
VIGLFDPAEARDFADVHALAPVTTRISLLELAAAADAASTSSCSQTCSIRSHGSPTTAPRRDRQARAAGESKNSRATRRNALSLRAIAEPASDIAAIS